MSSRRTQEWVERPYRLVVLELPSLLVHASADDKVDICGRLEALLDRQVRVVLMAPAGMEALNRDVCCHISGLSKVFLFGWTKDAQLFGFDQWGQPIRLAHGQKMDPQAVAFYVIDAVADPADISLEEVLVVGEGAEPGGCVQAFASPMFEGVHRIALADHQKLPHDIHRAVHSHGTVTGLLDGVLTQMG